MLPGPCHIWWPSNDAFGGACVVVGWSGRRSTMVLIVGWVLGREWLLWLPGEGYREGLLLPVQGLNSKSDAGVVPFAAVQQVVGQEGYC